MKKVLILGKGGQLATELVQMCPSQVELCVWGPEDWDFLEPDRLEDLLCGLSPEVVINAAAYTAVDKAESEQDLAMAVNGTAVEALAKACKKCECRLLHVSTDFVFDGQATQPYRPDDKENPLGVYGLTKLQGDRALLKNLPDLGIVVRTSWLYSIHGKNFVKTMLSLMEQKDSLRVVSDQRGCPTWAKGLAEVLWKMAMVSTPAGIYHWCDGGITSWYEFARAIQEEGFALGLLKKEIPIQAIAAKEYPTPARRPSFSALDCAKTVEVTGLEQKPWRPCLASMLGDLARQVRV